MICHYLPLAVENGNNMAAREQMAYAQFMAGMAFNNASLGYVHAIAHQLGGFYNLPHGVCNAILLPHVMQFNADVVAARFKAIAAAMGLQVGNVEDSVAASMVIASIRTMAQHIGIPAGFEALGVLEQDFAVLADNALKDACGLTNPRRAQHQDIVSILAAAM